MNLKEAIINVARKSGTTYGENPMIVGMEWGWLVGASVFVHEDEINKYLIKEGYKEYHKAH